MDHNLDFLKCHVHKGTENFLQTNLDHMMIPTITRPTRITQTSATLIDSIIVSQNLCGAFYSGIIPNDISDHLPSVCILHSIQCPRKAPVTIRSRDTRKKNLDSLKVELECTNWQNLLPYEEIDKNMESLHNYFQELLDKHVPEREFELSGDKVRREKWVTPGLLKSINHCKVLYRKSIQKDCTIKVREEYKTYVTMLKKIK